MSETEPPDEGDEQPKKGGYSWPEAVLDAIFVGSDFFVWVVGGVFRGLAWLAAAVVTSCN